MGARDCLKLLSQAAGRKVSTAEQDEFFSRLNQSKEALRGQYADDRALTIAAAKHAADLLMGEASSVHRAVHDAITNEALMAGGHLYEPSPYSVREGLRKLFQGRPGSDVGHKREATTGRYVGAPDWVGSSPQKLAALRSRLQKLVTEGAIGRYWYENSAKAVMDFVGGNKADAEKFVGLLSIYSQGSGGAANTTSALKAWYAWKAGKPIEAGRFPTEMGRKAEAWLNRGEDWGGVKTNNFYTDLMEEIDPRKADLHHSTMDMWMALAFDYGTNKLDQGPKYTFAQREIKRIADHIGWRPHQTQAAIWTAIKARVEGSEAERKQWERANGILRDVINANGKKSAEVVKGREYDHFRAATRFGMESKITQQQIDAGNYDFGTALGQRTAQVSWEATPGVRSGVLPGIHNAPMHQQVEYLHAITRALSDDHGNDLIDRRLGLLISHGDQGFSGWEGKTTSGIQQRAGVTVENGAVTGQPRLRVNLAADLRGMLLSQEAVAWHFPNFKSAAYGHNGVEFNLGRPLTEVETDNLYRALAERLGHTDSPPIPTRTGLRVMNFPQEKFDLIFEMAKPKPEQDKARIADLQKSLREKNGDFQKAVDEAILQQQWHDSIDDGARFESDGELRSNDWSNGDEDYRSRIREAQESLGEQDGGRGAGSSDLLKWADDELRPRVEAVNNDFAARYGWGSTEGPAASEPARGQNAGGDQQAGRGASLTGAHFSRQQRETLDGRYYGTGIKGQGAARISQSGDPRLGHRLYFYVDEGKGVFPESGVGGSQHNVSLDGIYDVRKDPDGIWKSKNDLPTAEERANARESALLDAGYKGYYVRELFHRQGAAVLIGDASHGVRPQRLSQEGRRLARPNVDRTVEAAAFKQLHDNPQGMVDKYIAKNGRTIDPDKAKAMFFPDGVLPHHMAASVHEPSSELSKLVYARLLETHKGEPVLFTAGGGASGKSESLAITLANKGRYGAIYDSTLSSFDSATRRIDQALGNGSSVDIFYTHRDLEKAAVNALNRKRVVPLHEIIKAHVGASDTIRKLAEHYKNDDRVRVEVMNNNGTLDEIRLGKIDDVRQYDHNTITRRVYDIADKHLKQGNITQDRHALFTSGRGGEGNQGGGGEVPAGEESGRAGGAGGGGGPKGAYDSAGRLIQLYEGADATTVVHESAHEYFDIYAKIANDPGSPLEIRQDVDTILRFLGIESLAKWHSMSFEDQRPYHEALVQSYERYMMESKAPSAMMNVFAKIRTWMLDTYKTLTDAGLEPSPELRTVFDKWAGQDIIPDRLKQETDAAQPRPEAPVPGAERAAGEHPIVSEAARIVEQNPDMMVPMADKDGNPIFDENNKMRFESARDLLDSASADVELSLKNDENVVSAVVQCVLGAM